MVSNIQERPKDQSEIGCRNTTVVFKNSRPKRPPQSPGIHTEKSFCEKHGNQHLAMDWGSNKPKCNKQVQATRIILHLGLPYTLFQAMPSHSTHYPGAPFSPLFFYWSFVMRSVLCLRLSFVHVLQFKWTFKILIYLYFFIAMYTWEINNLQSRNLHHMYATRS